MILDGIFTSGSSGVLESATGAPANSAVFFSFVNSSSFSDEGGSGASVPVCFDLGTKWTLL